MNQKAEKIYNIEHAENVVIDMRGLLEAKADKLNLAMERFPGLMDRTIAMLLSNHPSDGLFNHSTDNRSSPVSLKNTQDDYRPGDIVMSHWEIDRCIGRGSIGSVYEAHHVGSQYKSAIKVVSSEIHFSPIDGWNDMTHTVLGSYTDKMELDNMVELKGTGYIVDYEDHERIQFSDGSPGLIIRMELLQPIPKTMAKNDVIRLGIDICKALEYCSMSGIIHGDVKPSNIYLTKWGGFKLGDFSAAVKIGDKRDRIGTLKYMAPEVYCGKPFTSNIDTYSLGLVMYELMQKGKGDALSQRLSGVPLPPIPEVEKPLQSIILKACAFYPEDRYSSPTEMLDELRKLKIGR